MLGVNLFLPYFKAMIGYSKYHYLNAFKLPVLAIVAFYLGGWWLFMPAFFVFVILTIIDHWVGLNTTNVPAEAIHDVESDPFYKYLTYAWSVVQTAFLLWAVWIVSAGGLQTMWDWVGFAFSCALVTGGIGITVAHELGHKKSGLERFLSKLLLMQVCYMHFYVEHNRGHHVHVATPKDPATARANQHFYAFWWQSVVGSYSHAWSIETENLRRNNKPMWQNSMIVYTLLPILYCGLLTGVAFAMGMSHFYLVPVFFFTQSVIAFTLLEQVNYIEHYGIVRKQLPDGRYERVNPLHSWNASHQLSNFFLFQLQRHSDHHHNAIKRYQVLHHYEESPQLPFGYPTMVMIAMVPPLWFSMMNPRLQQWQQQTQQPQPA
jgi:alkane 1-monooxygenase